MFWSPEFFTQNRGSFLLVKSHPIFSAEIFQWGMKTFLVHLVFTARWLGADVHPHQSHATFPFPSISPVMWGWSNSNSPKCSQNFHIFSSFFIYFHHFSSFSWGDRCHLHAIGVHLFLQPSGVAILRSAGLTGERCHRLCPPGTGRHHRGGSEGPGSSGNVTSMDGFYMGNPWESIMAAIWAVIQPDSGSLKGLLNNMKTRQLEDISKSSRNLHHWHIFYLTFQYDMIIYDQYVCMGQNMSKKMEMSLKNSRVPSLLVTSSCLRKWKCRAGRASSDLWNWRNASISKWATWASQDAETLPVTRRKNAKNITPPLRWDENRYLFDIYICTVYMIMNHL